MLARLAPLGGFQEASALASRGADSLAPGHLPFIFKASHSTLSLSQRPPDLPSTADLPLPAPLSPSSTPQGPGDQVG